jgi:hypothetical protein
MLQIVVEGKGEAYAAPTLVRRLIYELGVYTVGVKGRARFCPRNRMIASESFFKNEFDNVRADPEATALLYLFDADDDCARHHILRMNQWADEAAAGIPWGIIMVTREYEAWFLAAIESLRGQRGIPLDATYPDNPELKRDAKGEMRRFLPTYSPTVDQTGLSAIIDLQMAYRNASTFRKLVDRVCGILRGLGEEPTIPESWTVEP